MVFGCFCFELSDVAPRPADRTQFSHFIFSVSLDADATAPTFPAAAASKPALGGRTAALRFPVPGAAGFAAAERHVSLPAFIGGGSPTDASAVHIRLWGVLDAAKATTAPTNNDSIAEGDGVAAAPPPPPPPTTTTTTAATAPLLLASHPLAAAPFADPSFGAFRAVAFGGGPSSAPAVRAAAVFVPLDALAANIEASERASSASPNGTTTATPRCVASRLPYGCLPLSEVYGAAVAAFRARPPRSPADDAGATAVVAAANPRASRAVAAFFAQPPHALRWDLLHALDLSQNVIGDNGLPPVLAVAAQCRALAALSLAGNGLSLPSAERLASSLATHPALTSLSVGDNDFFEGSGEALLRLLRTNRRLLACDVGGNGFSPYLAARIERQLRANKSEGDSDPYNALAPGWAYLNSPSDVPQEAWNLVLRTFALLAAVAPTTTNGAPTTTATSQQQEDRNAALASEGAASDAVARRAAESLPAASVAASRVLGLCPLEPAIPLAVTSRLFSAAMAAVHTAVAQVCEDPHICAVFGDACGAALAAAGRGTNTTAAGAGATARAAWPGEGASPLGADSAGDWYPRSFVKALFLPLHVLATVPSRWPEAARILELAGASHFAMGVRPRHYAAARRALVGALARLLGPDDLMDAAARAAWVQVTGLLVRVMLRGTPAVL